MGRLLSSLNSEELKKAVAVSEEKIQQRSQARPIFQQPFSLPENAQTLAGIASRAAGKSVNNFPTASKFSGKPFQQGISDSHSLLVFSDNSRDFCSAMWIRNHMCDAMLFIAKKQKNTLAADIHSDVVHNASVTASARPRCGELLDSARLYALLERELQSRPAGACLASSQGRAPQRHVQYHHTFGHHI